MQGIRPAVARGGPDPLPLLAIAVAALVLLWRGSPAILPVLIWVVTAVAVWCLLRDRVWLWRIRHRGGHLVIAGDATLAPIVKGEARSGNPGIVLTHAAQTGWIRRLRRLGSPHVTHEGGLGGYLRKARMVLLAGPRDEDNVALAHELLRSDRHLAARELPLPMIVRVDDMGRHAAVEEAFAEQRGSDHVQVRLISLPALIARALVRANVVDRVERIGTGERLLVVVGLTAITGQYVLDALTGGRFRDGRDLRVVILDRDPAAWERLVSRWPSVERLAAPTFITSAIDDAAMLATTIAALSESSGPGAVLIDAGDVETSIAALEAIDRVMLALGQVGPAYAVHAPATALASCPVVASTFGGGDIAERGELLLYERQEATARAVHEFTLEGRLDDGEALGSCPEVNGWDALSEAVRDQSRLLVDLHALKLRDIGARVVPGRGLSLALEPDDLAVLADAEHHRLTAARTLSDMREAPAPALPETAPPREIEQVRIINRLLARSGQHAVRDLRVLIAPGLAGDARAAAAELARDYPDRQLVFLGDLAEPTVRTVLHALWSAGYIVQVALAHHVATLTAGLLADDQQRFRSLVRHADRIIVPRPGEPVAAVLAGRAHRHLATSALQDHERMATA